MDIVTYEPPWAEDFLRYLGSGEMLPRQCARQAGTTLRTVLKYREDNAEFAEAYADAAAARADIVESEMFRRGVEGIEKGVYYQGNLVATEMQYSDTLLVKLAEAYAPEKFSPKVAHEHLHGGAITVTVRNFPLPEATVQQPVIDAEYTQVPSAPEDFV